MEDGREGDTLDWYRIETRASFRASEAWELEFVIPFDIKHVLHRDGSSESRAGVADIQQWISVSLFGLFTEDDQFQLGAGLSIPTGNSDPKGAEENGEEEILFGSGTFDPALRARYSLMPDWWGLSFSIGGQFPFYTNSYGYRGPIVAEASANLRLKPVDWFAADLALAGSARGSSFLDGEEQLGYTSLLVILSPNFIPSEWFNITPSFGYRIGTWSSDEGALPKLQFVASLRATFIW